MTIQRLLALNRQFYTEHGRDFSATRGRLQLGVLHVLEMLHGGESILDLGCGNGELARTLSRRGHRGPYLGLDFSLSLLNEAGRGAFSFPVKFIQADLASHNWHNVIARSRFASDEAIPYMQGIATLPSTARNDAFDIIFAFATLHHIPSIELRLNVIRKAHELLRPNGLFIHSNWQFLNSPRLKTRIQSWDKVGLSSQNVDPNDYLLDWKRGGNGLRYVHHFDKPELADLAKASGFEILETFYSDGEHKRLGLYQVWKKAESEVS